MLCLLRLKSYVFCGGRNKMSLHLRSPQHCFATTAKPPGKRNQNRYISQSGKFVLLFFHSNPSLLEWALPSQPGNFILYCILDHLQTYNLSHHARPIYTLRMNRIFRVPVQSHPKRIGMVRGPNPFRFGHTNGSLGICNFRYPGSSQ